MKSWFKTWDRAALTLYEGFVSESLGWRGAVLFYILISGLIPLGSLVNAFWLSAAILVGFKPEDFGFSSAEFYSACAAILLVGLLGIGWEMREMARLPIADREALNRKFDS